MASPSARCADARGSTPPAPGQRFRALNCGCARRPLYGAWGERVRAAGEGEIARRAGKPVQYRDDGTRCGRKGIGMASYHLNVKTISRSQGRSATGAAAYRAAERIACDRYGIEHDYTRKRGVVDTKMFAPSYADVSTWIEDREQLWNLVEARETRKNSVVAREWTVALPAELSPDARRDLAHGFACTLVERYGVIADVAIHEPHREGDERNHHAHILTTTRSVEGEGFGEKTRELDVKKTSSVEVKAMRRTWAELQNAALERAELESRVDHRSLEAQRKDAERLAVMEEIRGREDEMQRALALASHLRRQPEPKLGPRTSAIERKAKKEAERDGVEYVPVTERGAEVAERRAERSLFEAVRERFDTARQTYAQARKQGEGRRMATTEALRALVDRERDRDARKVAEREAERRAAREEADAKQREEERLAREQAEAQRLSDERLRAQGAANVAWEEAFRMARERANDPRSDAEIERDRAAAIRHQAEQQREEQEKQALKQGRRRGMKM